MAAAGASAAPAAASGHAASSSAGRAPKQQLFAGAPFPPADVPPTHERTAKPGDGKWQPMDDGILPGGGSAMYRTTLHPHPIKKWVFVTLIAFDRRHADVQLMAGTDEPESDVVAASKRPGLVPAADHAALLAVFNGGFKVKHGKYGMLLDGDQYVEPGDDACTVAYYRDGSIRIGSWPKLKDSVAEMSWYRQTPPCLVEKGDFEPRLPREFRSRRWGSAKGGVIDIRRSALALDQSGRALIYAFGDWVTAGDLARSVKAAGGVDVAQLDINWSYTRFFLFDHPEGGPPEIRETIMPKLKFNRTRYIGKSSYRDFFYVTRRSLGVE